LNPITEEQRAKLHQEFLAGLKDVRREKHLNGHPHYKTYDWLVQQSLRTHEYFEPALRPLPSTGETVKIVAWNIERGMAYERIENTLKFHHAFRHADIILLTETDAGMARSGNRHIARDLGRALNFYTAFGPAYMNLDKGNGAEAKNAVGENTLALQGHSILSRYPMENIELIHLPSTKDHMHGKERQVGWETAIAATVKTHKGPVHAVCLHMSLRSSRKQRVRQMETVIQAIQKRKGPAIIGGDWNTTTYNAHMAWATILGFWRRVFMGVTHVIHLHYPNPDHYFEKRLFTTLHDNGFETEDFNFPGGCTVHYNVADPENFQNLGDWIPNWCFDFVRWAVRGTGGQCSFKLDWFAARGLKGSNAAIVYDLPRGQKRISDHDPILVDVTPL
jgi:endonuclease/exonuclease/phosphatase family metal-dependent hydrolase